MTRPVAGAAAGAVSALLLCGLACPAGAADLYRLDQNSGSIVFTVGHLGGFMSHGRFPRFAGRLVIDRAHPDQTTIDVTADATSVDIPWIDGPAMLRGSDFFDAAHFPAVRFVSGSVTGLDPKHFQVNGTLELRGITEPLILDATLTRHPPDPVSGTEIAEFIVTGTLSRAGYGMTTQKPMISDGVGLLITARIALPTKTP